MRISPKGLAFIKSFEGFVPYVYDDLRAPVNGRYREWKGESVRGTLTIGYGHTNAAKHPLKITRGLRVTEEEATEILDVDLDECEEQVNKYVTVDLTQGQFDALTSFNFNCGPGNLKKLIRPLNKGDYATTRAKFDLYVKSKGQTLRGLQRRRDGEQVLWDSEAPELPTEEHGVDHPAEVEKESEPMSPATAAAAGAAGGTGVGAGATTIPAPPSQLTESLTNAGLWRAASESVKAFALFTLAEPVLVGGIVSVMVILIWGPKLAKRMGWT